MPEEPGQVSWVKQYLTWTWDRSVVLKLPWTWGHLGKFKNFKVRHHQQAEKTMGVSQKKERRLKKQTLFGSDQKLGSGEIQERQKSQLSSDFYVVLLVRPRILETHLAIFPLLRNNGAYSVTAPDFYSWRNVRISSVVHNLSLPKSTHCLET